MVTAGFLLVSGETGSLSWWPMALGFYAWSAVPYAILALAMRYAIKGNISRIVIFLTALVVCIGGIYLLANAFIIHPGAQSGIVFIFMPFYQCVAAAIGAGISLLTRKVETFPAR
ncbi:hypothetical protein GF373_06710 [bacterium]|nr:hypothetical protein [bacterium]